MSHVVLVLGIFTAALGVLGMIDPGRLIGFVRLWQTPIGLYAAALVRIVLGLALFLAAQDSRTPGVLRVLGVVVFVAGLVLPLLGLERFRGLIDWWAARSPAFIRAWAGLASAFGLFLVYAVV